MKEILHPTPLPLEKEKELAFFQEHLNNICLSGEGKGRVYFEKNSNTFSYESLFANSGNWTLALHLPLYGEENFHLDWHEIPQGKIVPKGSFYQRILNAAQSQSDASPDQTTSYSELLDQFLLYMGQFFYFYSRPGPIQHFQCAVDPTLSRPGKEIQGSCDLITSPKKILWKNSSEEFSLIFGKENPYYLLVEGSEFDSGSKKFEKLTFSLKDGQPEGNGRKSSTQLQLTLYHSQCVTP